LGLGGAALTRTEWRILEVLVGAEAQERFGTNCATVDEMSLAAREVRKRFQSEEELRTHVKALASWGRRIVRRQHRENREAHSARIAERCSDCGRHPAPLSFLPGGTYDALALCHACAMHRLQLDTDHTATITLLVDLFGSAAEPGDTADTGERREPDTATH
jgi:hypothetical protein